MPRAAPEEKARWRQALLDQLAYLQDELEALRPIIDRVPEPLQAGRPLPGDLSLKETYGLLATLDTDVRPGQLRRMVAEMAAEDEPHFDAVDEAALVAQADWNGRPIEAILKEAQAARQALVEALRALPKAEWARAGVFAEDGRDVRRDVYAFAHAITQYDTDVLRAIGQRLHESHLTRRLQDLPK